VCPCLSCCYIIKHKKDFKQREQPRVTILACLDCYWWRSKIDDSSDDPEKGGEDGHRPLPPCDGAEEGGEGEVAGAEAAAPPPAPNLSVHGFACWRRRSPNTTPSMTPVARGEATGAQAALPPSHETPDDPEEGGEGEAGAQAAPHPH
jgi:hypothetical protein